MMINRRWVCICFLVVSMVAGAQGVKYSNEFMAIGVDARSMAMGGAVVGNVSNATAGYWNPAGLMHLSYGPELALMHAEWFAGISKLDYASVALPMNNQHKPGILGLSVIRFGVDDIQNTLHLVDADGSPNYDNISFFSAADYGFVFSYAQRFPGWPDLNIGANAKIIHRRLGSFATAWGLGVDAGAQYRKGSWRFGALARDITTTFNAWFDRLTEEEREALIRSGNELPENSTEITLPRLIAGAGYLLEFNHQINLLAEVDVEVTTDGKRNALVRSDPFSIDPRAGLELGYHEIIFLRGGINLIQRKMIAGEKEEIFTFQPNAGIGLKIGWIHVDYAFTGLAAISNEMYAHVVSLRLELDKPLSLF